MASNTDEAIGDGGRIEPEDIVEQFGERDRRAITEFLTPGERARLVQALIEANGKELSAAKLIDVAGEGLSKSGFYRHADDLLEMGIMVEGEKVGNAQTYALNVDHPIAQALKMLDNIVAWGETPVLLGEQFIAEDNAMFDFDE